MPRGNRINVTFSHFDLEFAHNDNCKDDYLELQEGSSDSPNTEIGRYCSNSLPKRFTSSLNQVFVTFVTDRFMSYNGFRLEWALDGCGGVLTRPFDTFTSPGYPRSYPLGVECEWQIEVEHGQSIEITILDVYMEKTRGCDFDKVTVYAGPDDSGPKVLEACHSDKPVVYTSSSNQLFVKFISDDSFNGRGFKAKYKSVEGICGGKYSSHSGVITSANYPKNYPHNQNCEYLLEVDKNHVVNLTFVDLDVETTVNCTDDYVEVPRSNLSEFNKQNNIIFS